PANNLSVANVMTDLQASPTVTTLHRPIRFRYSVLQCVVTDAALHLGVVSRTSGQPLYFPAKIFRPPMLPVWQVEHRIHVDPYMTASLVFFLRLSMKMFYSLQHWLML